MAVIENVHLFFYIFLNGKNKNMSNVLNVLNAYATAKPMLDFFKMSVKYWEVRKHFQFLNPLPESC